ncbi:MAG: tRNA pseudouridine(55) synthase TruB [Angelakisella sp.]|jgi:tRNA pseudouridine55 synthase|nr:tRNA pseudouridine(55) synthase TruB [Angelakisella sp.]
MPEGILCIDKPQGWTSFDVVAKCRGITKCRKIGHGGTLDPMATGVLPLFFGRAVKAIDLMPSQQKRYIAGIRFGVTTDTQDITGKVLDQSDAPVAREALEAALAAQRGEIKQLPPMYSAVWVDGKRLYDLARKGREVERPLRDVTVHRLELLDFDQKERACTIDVTCSKGTYIRTICHDVGAALGCGGALSSLRRVETLGFTDGQCVTLEQLEAICQAGELENSLLPVESAFAGYGRVYLSPHQANMFCSGAVLDTRRVRHPDTTQPLRVYEGGGASRFLGLARVEPSTQELIIIKLFAPIQ